MVELRNMVKKYHTTEFAERIGKLARGKTIEDITTQVEQDFGVSPDRRTVIWLMQQ